MKKYLKFLILLGIIFLITILIISFIKATITSYTYDFNDKTNNKAYNQTSGTNYTAATLLSAGTELPVAGYTLLNSNNNQNATSSVISATNDWIMFRYVFTINQTKSGVTNLNITWVGGETADDTNIEVIVRDWSSNTWLRIGTVSSTRSTLTLNLTGTTARNHIGGNNNVTIVVWNPSGSADTGEQIRADYVKVDITYDDTPAATSCASYSAARNEWYVPKGCQCYCDSSIGSTMNLALCSCINV